MVIKAKPKRDTAITVRLKKETADKLRKIAEKSETSQTDVLEQLIEAEYLEMTKQKK